MKKASSTRLSRHTIQRLGFAGLSLLALLTVIPIILIIGHIIVQGAPSFSWGFLK